MGIKKFARDYVDPDSRARWLRDARTLAENYAIVWAIWGND